MSGLLFIVTIPTEDTENDLKRKPHKLQFDSLPNVQSSPKENQPIPEYGTFKNSVNMQSQNLKSNEEQNAVSNDECATPKRAQNVEQHKLTFDENYNSEQHENDKSNEIENSKSKKSWGGLREIVSSAKKIGRRNVDDMVENRFLDIPVDSSMETIIHEIFKRNKIDSAVWQLSKNQSYYQIQFTVEADYRHEIILNILNAWGIGEREGSCVSVVPCTIYSKSSHFEQNQNDNDQTLFQKQTAWNRFLSSIHARLNVAQIVQEVKQDASITFDFITLILCAGSLAAFGLVENSTILLVSSMLISPLMGPIIAITFGIVIKDKSLVRFGLANELFAIIVATSIGFIFGLIIGSIEERYITGDTGVTQEMITRCEVRSLIIGILTALPSGAAVAIAILGENIGSLVGVAISASLLPPAVNAGLLWSLACLFLIHEDNNEKYHSVITSKVYSDNQAVELAIHGLMSMLLTIANIICILVMGVIALKIKEVAPINAESQQRFWKHDIKVARVYNQANHTEEDEFTQKLADGISEFQRVNDINADYLRNIGCKNYQNTWSPSTSRQKIFRPREYRPSLADLENICAHLKGSPPPISRRKHSISFGESWSTPKYSSFEEHIRTGGRRRASMPFIATFGVPPTGISKNPRLEKINEMNVNGNKSSSNKNEDSQEKTFYSNNDTNDKTKSKRSIRKFIVTRAEDPLKK